MKPEMITRRSEIRSERLTLFRAGCLFLFGLDRAEVDAGAL